jgi:hypothetical protein
MLNRIICVLGLLTCLAAHAATKSPTPSANPILGAWTWTREANNCVETYTYHADGTEQVTSGDEKSDSVYQISSSPSAQGFYKLTDKVLKDYGGKDCADDASDSTGQESSVFVVFHPEGDMYLVCQTESMDNCFGPLKRIKK